METTDKDRKDQNYIINMNVAQVVEDICKALSGTYHEDRIVYAESDMLLNRFYIDLKSGRRIFITVEG